MELREVRKNCTIGSCPAVYEVKSMCAVGACPSIQDKGDEFYYVVGRKLSEDEIREKSLVEKVGDGEGVVAVPKELLYDIRRDKEKDKNNR